jgi:alpha-beta hydrolase superfamily lysophospholipase
MVQKALLTTMGRLMLDVALPLVSKPEWVTSDPEVIREAEQDPLGHRQITPRLALFIDGQGRVTLNRAAHWAVPTLLMYSPRDRLISPPACVEFKRRADAQRVTVQAFPELAHNMLRDTHRHLVFEAAGQWLSTHFGKTA